MRRCYSAVGIVHRERGSALAQLENGQWGPHWDARKCVARGDLDGWIYLQYRKGDDLHIADVFFNPLFLSSYSTVQRHTRSFSHAFTFLTKNPDLDQVEWLESVAMRRTNL